MEWLIFKIKKFGNIFRTMYALTCLTNVILKSDRIYFRDLINGMNFGKQITGMNFDFYGRLALLLNWRANSSLFKPPGILLCPLLQPSLTLWIPPGCLILPACSSDPRILKSRIFGQIVVSFVCKWERTSTRNKPALVNSSLFSKDISGAGVCHQSHSKYNGLEFWTYSEFQETRIRFSGFVE